MKETHYITRPIIIDKLSFHWWRGWTCDWRSAFPTRGVPDGGTLIGYAFVRNLLRRLNWWIAPMPDEKGSIEHPVLADMFSYVRTIATGFDCDVTAHRNNTFCFVCEAEALLRKYGQPADPRRI